MSVYLNPGSAGVVESDNRSPDEDRLVHHLANLLGVGHGQGAAEHREVLAEDVGPPAVDEPVAGDHRVPGDLLLLHPEVGAGVLHEHVVLHEGPRVQQHGDPLPGSQLPFLVLRVNPLLSTLKEILGSLQQSTLSS